MYVGTTICNLLTFMSIIHAKDSKHRIYARGENATVHIAQLEVNLTKVIEITFFGYTSKTHVTNVIFYEKKKNKKDISINENYNGRITMIDMKGSSISFLLLSVDFMDSGNFTVSQDSQSKGATDIFVARQQLILDNMERGVLLFTCNKTNTSLITLELMIAKLRYSVVKYNVIQKNCTEVGELYANRIESCVLNGTHLLITIRKVNIHDMGMYVAWDFSNILLDSLYLHIRENIKSSQHGSGDTYSTTTSFVPSLFSSDSENYRFEWCLSAVVVVFFATGLIINVVVRHQQRTMPTTKSCNQKHLDAKRIIARSSRNCIKFSNEIRERLTENYSLANPSGFPLGETEEKDIINKKCLYAQVNDCRKSVVNNFQLHLIPKSLDESIRSEPTYEYDLMNDYIEQETETQEHQSMDLADLESHGQTMYYDFTDKDSSIL